MKNSITLSSNQKKRNQSWLTYTCFPMLHVATCIHRKFWLVHWIVCVVDQTGHFGFGFSTLNWNLLYSVLVIKSISYWCVTDSPLQTIGASFFLKQWGPYNVAIWVKLKILLFNMSTNFLVFDKWNSWNLSIDFLV